MSLVKLIKQGKTSEAKSLILSSTFNPTETDPRTGDSLLHISIRTCSIDLLNLLLKSPSCPSLSTRNNEDLSPLELSIELRDFASFQSLISHNALSLGEDSAALLSADLPDSSFLRLLLHSGSMAKDPLRLSPVFRRAAAKNNFEIVKFLVENCPQIDYSSIQVDSPNLATFAAYKGGEEIIEILLRHIERGNQKEGSVDNLKDSIAVLDTNGEGILHFLAKKGNKTLIDLGVKVGLDPLIKNKTGEDAWNLLEEYKRQKETKNKEKLQEKQHKNLKKREANIVKNEEKELKNVRRIEEDKASEQKDIDEMIHREQFERRKVFYCIAFVIVFFVLLYLYTKARIAKKDKFLIDL